MTIYTFLSEAPPPRTIFRRPEEKKAPAAQAECCGETPCVAERLLAAVMDVLTKTPDVFEEAVRAMRVITREFYPDPGPLT